MLCDTSKTSETETESKCKVTISDMLEIMIPFFERNASKQNVMCIHTFFLYLFFLS